MAEPLRFYSTNHHVAPATLDEALLQGQAADKGLFLPETYPQLSLEDLAALGGKSYTDVACDILRRYSVEVFDDVLTEYLCGEAYDFEVPLENVTGRRYLMRLDRGPTASFKDFAARMMARWMSSLMQEEDGRLVILTATSGDTGSAVAHAYHRVDRIRVVVLFPPAEVSARQRRQMTTIGANVATIAVDGQFDDCQAMVKAAFSDLDLSAIRMSSANSINIGRLLPQCVYYVYAYANLADVEAGERITISVPSGNFGDMMGAVIAKKMGVPIERIVIATNANDEVPKFLATGEYGKISPSRVCISNAMNVGHPSNLARLVDVYGGWLDETGTLQKPPDLQAMRNDLFAVSISDAETRATIRAAYEQHETLLEPHGAVGWAGLERYFQKHPEADARVSVSIETAHPAKFPEEIESLLGITPEVPPSLAGLEQKPEKYERLPAEYAPFRDWLLKRFVR